MCFSYNNPRWLSVFNVDIGNRPNVDKKHGNNIICGELHFIAQNIKWREREPILFSNL